MDDARPDSAGASTNFSVPPGDQRAGAERDTVDHSLDPSAGAAGGVPAESGLPESFGRYRIARRIGRGGMGTVYLAHDTQLDRPVALKVPHFSRRDAPEAIERFYREARAMAALRHPNLCPVFDVGENGGVSYLTMAFIEGEPLSEILRRPEAAGPLDVASTIRKLALALAEVHAAGVVHRDLKPSNIMIDRRGEPIVMDFGLAGREHDVENRLTRSGAIVGTPAYMAPEQFETGTSHRAATADVYSLGVVLFELLCGRVPFQGGLTEIVGQILSPVPRRPSDFRQGVDRGLEEICLKAMARRAPDRYQSMAALAAALAAWEAGQGQTQLLARRQLAAARPALRPEWAHDLLIGYVSVDDELPPGIPGAGWVTTLFENLDWRLRQLCGKGEGLSVWLDADLFQVNEPDDEQADRIERTASIVLVVSPGFLQSSCCRPDGRFFEQMRRLREQGRGVFLVERDPIERSSCPGWMSHSRCFQFWEDRDESGPRLLGYPRPSASADFEYFARIDDLARSITEHLRQAAEIATQNAGQRPVQPSIAQGDSANVVYVAEVTDDLDPHREALARSLRQCGFRVLPESWLPRHAEPFRAEVAANLKQALLFVQLLGPVAGKRPPSEAQTYSALQYEIGVQSGVPIRQWRDPRVVTTAVDDAPHRALLEGVSVEAIEFEQFRRMVAERARHEQGRRRGDGAVTTAVDQGFIFVNVAAVDVSVAEELCRLLEDRGCAYALPVREGRPDEIRRDLEANLVDCDGLIVVYGASPEPWVREQLRQWRKVLYLRKAPPRALAVFEGPPPEKAPLGMRLPQMTVIDCRGGLDPGRVGSFLDSFVVR